MLQISRHEAASRRLEERTRELERVAAKLQGDSKTAGGGLAECRGVLF